MCRQDVNVHVALSTDVTIEDKVFNRSTENKAIPVTDVHVSKNLSCSHVDNSDLIYEEVRKSGKNRTRSSGISAISILMKLLNLRNT